MSQPTAYDQYILALMNRARANPGAEAARLGIGLNDGLAAGTLSDTPKPPLAFNPALIAAAQGHGAWMLANNSFSHTGANGSSPGDRMAAAGYRFAGAWSWGENIGIRYGSGVAVSQATADALEAGLFRSPGHRENILNGGFREAGVGVVGGTYQGQSAATVTEDFATSGTQPFLTGVAFDDRNGDTFYEPGEGLGGVQVQVRSATGAVYQTTTWDAGGYQIQVPAGAYQVTFSGGALAAPVTETASLASQNVEVDLVRAAAPGGSGGGTGGTGGAGTGATGGTGATLPPVPATTATVTGTASGDRLSVSGHALANALGGNDLIFVGGGGNVVNGGAGNDSVRIAASSSGNRVEGGAGSDSVTDGGGRNVLVLNAAGQGQDNIWGQVLQNGDVFDLRAALAATAWDGQAGTLGDYLHLGAASNGADATVSLSAEAGGAASVVAVLHGQGAVSLAGFLTHAVTL